LLVDGEVARFVVMRRGYAIDAPCLLVKGQSLAAENVDSGTNRIDLFGQGAPPPNGLGIGCLVLAELLGEATGVGIQRAE
jgi:hypothetical protein